MKASDLFVRCLENEGVKYIFGVPGEETEDILFSLEKSSIQFIPTRHEQGASFMADVWGRLSGTAGVCLSTLGPGATNLVTGVADANMDKAPLVAISAQGGLNRVYRENHQFIDLVGLFRPVTKWNASITRPEIIPEIVRKAFKIAEAEKPGATHIEFPEDIADMDAGANARPLSAIRVRRPDPDETAVGLAVDILKSAQRPLIIAGNGTVRKASFEQLRVLVREFNIPVVHTFMGQGAVLDAEPQSLFTLGFNFRDYIVEAIDRADVILTIGYDIAEYSPDRWNPRRSKTIIHIDYSPAEVYAHYEPAVEIVADIRATLEHLGSALTAADAVRWPGNWYKPVREKIITDISGYKLRGNQSFTIPGVLDILMDVMHGDDLLISDVGSHKIWIARNFSACCANGCIISNGFASMGIALPGAVAASLLNPGRRVIAAMGDGGFMMNSQELETAKRLKLGFVTLVFNDNDYGLISWKQEIAHGRSTGTKLTNPDFKAYAESFGIKGYAPKNPAQLRTQLARAMEKHELCVFEIPIKTDVNNQLIKKLKSAGKK